MGTTCTTLVLLPRGAIVGHVGDSRCYRIRGRTIEQLSRDHSLVWELETAGGMSREQANDAAPKNIITRSMGPHPHVDVDLEGPFPVTKGDVFLLCSDGLSGQVADEEIGLLAAELEPQEAVPALIGLALVRGAPDNVTVIVARAGEEEVSKPSRSDSAWPLSEEATTNQRQASHGGGLVPQAGAVQEGEAVTGHVPAGEFLSSNPGANRQFGHTNLQGRRGRAKVGRCDVTARCSPERPPAEG
jgi:protein phosphatase